MQPIKVGYFRICLFTILFVFALFYTFSSTFKFSNNNVELVVTVTEVVQIPKNETKPIFIIKSYIYQNSIIYKGNDAIITLFNGERANYSATPLSCRRELSNGKIEKAPAEITAICTTPLFCKLQMYRSLCIFPLSNENDETIKYELRSRSENEKNDSQELILSKPEIKKRTFVSCMSRMIAFENWALLITALETYRFYGGDLMVAYVECALKEVIELMEMYEKDGILRVEPAYKGAEIPNIPYDPDGETEYANQITNANQCLYEFRESAEFIAFTDWDDILIGTPRFPKFADALRPHSLANPNAGEFTIDRLNIYMEKAFRPNGNPFSLKTLQKSIIFSNITDDPKIIVRPNMILGTWIHKALYFENEKFHSIKVNQTEIFMVHLRNLILDVGEVEEILSPPPLLNGNHFINGNELQENMERMFRKYKFKFNSSKYSYSKSFHKSIYGCYKKVINIMINHKLDFCPSHKYCNYPKQNLEVMKVETKHKKPFKLAEFIWYERENAKFIESNQGCF